MTRSVLALILLLGFCAPAFAADKPANSIFLVARGGLTDPNFRNAVVLVTHEQSEPTGVIINVPTNMPLGEVYPDIERLSTAPDKLFFGGPVHPNVLTFIVRAATPPEGAIEVLEGVYLSSSREVLRKWLSERGTDNLRVYSGYAAWDTEQLAAEISRGDWRWTQADGKAIFEMKPQVIWWELNRRAPRGIPGSEPDLSSVAARTGNGRDTPQRLRD